MSYIQLTLYCCLIESSIFFKWYRGNNRATPLQSEIMKENDFFMLFFLLKRKKIRSREQTQSIFNYIKLEFVLQKKNHNCIFLPRTCSAIFSPGRACFCVRMWKNYHDFLKRRRKKKMAK